MAITQSAKTGRLPLGDRFVEIYRITLSAASQTGESISTGLSRVESVQCAEIGENGAVDVPTFELNADGTTEAEGDSLGLVGVEIATAAATRTFEVTVIGRA